MLLYVNFFVIFRHFFSAAEKKLNLIKIKMKKNNKQNQHSNKINSSK